MSPTKQTAFRLPDELLDAMQVIKDRDGIPMAEQARRALSEWVEGRSEAATPKKTARKRAATRKRA